MASLLSHPAVPLALAIALGSKTIPPRLLMLGILSTLLPDADVLAFKFGIPYASPFGHRGFSHSLLFAGLLGLAAMPWSVWMGARKSTVVGFVALSAASHGVLDALTTGGLGVAFLWPLSDERYFLPWQVIAVSPIGVGRFLSERGLAVLLSEFCWVWLPLLSAAMIAKAAGTLRSRALGS
ncbi:metal-dependent hydrolase [Chitinimonas arctica]|uniref:Metal-dependent hydrolase n=1 Tax=Chitinimonas arctica TaxID=2594795 RepID=A0A516SBR0_9NEIS|nr:metal-dependent hydrolase [Chitinimonas arctica]QDQ25586.1 metal-dependent hydrolase [Chitinimonas arctica]